MTQQTRCGTWVETFPGNLRWSNATQIVKGMVPWSATAAGQIDRVGQRMQARLAAGEDQDRRCAAIAPGWNGAIRTSSAWTCRTRAARFAPTS